VPFPKIFPTARASTTFPSKLFPYKAVGSATSLNLWYPTPPAVNRWVSATGSGGGLDAGDPMSLSSAIATTSASGLVFGLLPGTYNLTGNRSISNGGSSGNPVVYRAADLNNPPLLKYNGTGVMGAPSGTWNYIFQIGNGVNYVDFYRLNMQGDGGGGAGNTWALAGVKTGSGGSGTATHHIGVYGCRIWNMGTQGIGLGPPAGDYYTAVGNHIWRCGFNQGDSWSSLISLHTSRWQDSYAGFHSFIIGNVLAAGWDAQGINNGDPTQHTDGNGFILDLQFDNALGAPPCLVANNIVYGCGGRGIIFTNSKNAWAVNNTCFKNGLDPSSFLDNSEGLDSNGASGNSGNLKWINNAVQGITDDPDGSACYYVSASSQATHVMANNVAFGGVAPGHGGGTPQVYPSSFNTTSRVTVGDPKFKSPPALDASSVPLDDTPSPWAIAQDSFLPQAGSSLISAGMDPRTHGSATVDLITGMNQYLVRDIRGADRGNDWDAGAFQVTGVEAGDPPPTVPSQPTNVSGIPGDEQIIFSFSAPSNNGSSAIDSYRVTVSPGGATFTSSSSPITATGLTNGTGYTATVAAHNAVGYSAESTASAEVTPSGVGDTLLSSGFESTSPAVEGWGGNAATASFLSTGAANSGTQGWELDNEAGFFIFHSVGGGLGMDVRGRVYFRFPSNPAQVVRVLGFRDVNASLQIARAELNTDGTVTLRNAGTTAVHTTGVLATNTWHYLELRVVTAASPTASNGTLELRVNGSTVYGPVANANVNTVPIGQIVIGELNGGSNVSIDIDDVLVRNGAWPGSSSITAPGAPTSVTAAGGDTQSIVSFVAPSNDGGDAITGYRVTSTPGSITATGASSPITVTGLTNGTSYTFTVAATNSVGYGSESSASNSVTPSASTVMSSGFEEVNATTLWNTTTSRLVVGAARTGGIGWRHPLDFSGSFAFRAITTSLGDDVRSRIYFRISASPAKEFRVLGLRNAAGSTTVARIHLDTIRQLIVQNGAGTTVYTHTSALTTATWHYLELRTLVAASPTTSNGTLEVRLNGTTIYGPVTNANLSTGAVGQIVFGDLNGGATNLGANADWDDVLIARGTWPGA
jgi:hypothetical protein